MENPSFIDAIARLQKQRELRNADFPGEVQFYDRSVVCTAALAAYLGHGFSPFLSGELQRIKNGSVYELQVFFIRNLGFITQTAARRITFEENLRFEKVHEDTYRRLGFPLCYVERGTVSERVQNIREAIQRRTEKARLSLARR
jgi:predicted ATPase